MSEELLYIETDPKYSTGALLNFYNGDYSIVAANEGSDGKLYLRFGEVELKNKTVALPIAGKLGNLEMAIGILEHYLSYLKKMKGNVSTKEEPATQQPEMPF